VDNGRCCGLTGVACLNAMDLQVLVFPARLLRLTIGAISSTGASALYLRFRHAHHPFGDAFCFLFVLIAGCADFQLGLDRSLM
jgi:hypothetical protein